MKVQIGILTDGMQALKEFSNTVMPMATAYKLRRIIAAARKEIDLFAEVERDLVKKHEGVATDLGDGIANIKFKDEATTTAYKAEREEARKVEVDIPGEKLTEADMMTIPAMKPSVLSELDWLIA